MPVTIYPVNSFKSRTPPDPLRPCDRAKSHPHSSPRDSNPKERASQPNSASDDFSTLPSRRQASNQYISFWLSGRALDSGQVERQFKSLCLCCACFRFFFCCTWVKIPQSAYVSIFFCCTERFVFHSFHSSRYVYLRVPSTVQQPSAALSKYVFYSTCSFCLLCHLYPTRSRNSLVFNSFSIVFRGSYFSGGVFCCCALVPGTLALDLPTLSI